MKIIQLIRKPVSNLPFVYTVGEVPQPISDGIDPGPVVEKIVFFREGKLDSYPRAHYVVHIASSNTRRRIDTSEVSEVAYEIEEKKKEKKEEGPLPGDENDG